MHDNELKTWKLQYQRTLELGLVFSLLLIIIVFQLSKKFQVKATLQSRGAEIIQMENIPQTQQQKQAQAPARPSVPIASEDETLPEDETIDFSEFDVGDSAPPPPPPPDDDEAIVFVPYDEPPEPIGGFLAIQKALQYPEIARKAGVEGRVVIWARVDESGNVVNTKVQKSLGPNGCDEAAIAAIQSVKWKPAKQRDRAVKVWIAVPVDFKLR
ncbi:energy transducer TonB [bacterium]|nr:energy transducer TonB [bacterium]